MEFDFDPRQEAALARKIMQRGDYGHAATHLGYALAGNPNDPDLLNMLETILQSSADPLTHVQPDAQGGMHYTKGALRAYALAKQGKLDDALGLLAQVHRSIPANLYLPWAVDWLENAPRGGLLRSRLALDPGTLAGYLMSDISKYTSGGPCPTGIL